MGRRVLLRLGLSGRWRTYSGAGWASRPGQVEPGQGEVPRRRYAAYFGQEQVQRLQAVWP